jgi:hypothetical protein
MKLKPLLTLILFAASFVATAQQNNIPSGQKLYIDFNGSVSDNSLTGLSPFSTNISYEADRNNNPLRVGKFGGCNQTSYLTVPDSNPNQMDFTTGGTIAMWAKPDLNNSMNPADGSCIASGRHTFFSKGGDGFNTPPGFYAYTFINNGMQTIAFESSSNSGNVRDSFTIPYTDAWHHYAFVFTTTNLKVYVDGVLKRNATINLSFTEANNQALYIGTIGPKSTPVNGITYWLPFGGLMDEFRLFTKTLTAAEVTEVFQFADASTVAPNVSFFKEIISAGSFACSVSSKMTINEETVLISGVTDFVNDVRYIKMDIYNNNKVLLKSEILDSLYSNCTPIVMKSVEGSGGLLSFELGNRIGVISVNLRKLVFIDSTFSSTQPSKVFFYNGFIYYGRTVFDQTGLNDFKLSKITISGIIVQTITLADANVGGNSWESENVVIDWNKGKELLFSGSQRTYIFDLDSWSFTSTSISGERCRWVGNDFIVTNTSGTYRLTKQFGLINISSDIRKIHVLSNGDYFLSNDFNILKYGSNHTIKGGYNSIGNFILLPSERLMVSDNNQLKIYDANVNLLWVFNIMGIPVVYEDLEQNLFLVKNGDGFGNNTSEIIKLFSNGQQLWSKQINGRTKDLEIHNSGEISYLSNYSIGFISSGSRANYYLTYLTKDQMPCDYDVSTNMLDTYCSSATSKSAFITLGGRIDDDYNGPLIGLPTDFEAFWEKDGVKIQNNGSDVYQIDVITPGTYKATIIQGNCNKSITKNVTFSTGNNPSPPVITTLNPAVCEGDSVTLVFTGCDGTVNWSPYVFDNNTNDNFVKFKPTTSASYTATCFKVNTAYGNCTSEPSNSVAISLTTLPEVIGLAGNSPLSATYRAERINSQQNVIINGAVDYKSKNNIVLNPGFSTQDNAVFNAKIVNSCIE